MSNPVLKRNNLGTMLGFATVGLLISALSVHPQTLTDGSNAKGAAKPSPDLMNQVSQAATDAGKAGGAASTGSDAAGAGKDKSEAPGAASSAAGSTKTSTADRKMMRDLAYANIDEIETAKLAKTKSKNEQVGTFAQKMIDDHTKALNDLTKLAQTKGVPLPTKPDPKHQAAAKKLSALSGDEFDRQYLAQAGVNDHRNARQLFQRASTRAKDPDLKTYAGNTLPVVEQHLKMAEQMSSGKKGSARAGG